MDNSCPVCGYDLKEPVMDSLICVCCGTQYGYHDSTASHAKLREHWIDAGAQWHSRRVLPPAGWSFAQQLRGIGYEVKAVKTKQSVKTKQLEVI